MLAGTEKLDCHARVITPENIEFEYDLAGPFQRLPAFLFDVAVRVACFLALLFVGGMLLPFLPLGGTLVNVAAVIGFFLLSWFYGMFFETRFNGRTIGKMVFKLRAISTDGRPINASQAALRNLLRLADMNLLLPLQIFSAEAPPMYIIPTMLVGFASMTLTRKMQRLGDLAAGTMVVCEQRRRAAFNLQPEDLRAYGLAELVPVTFVPSVTLAQTIGLYMENRKRLNPLRRNDIARHLADPLIQDFGMMPDTSPDLLLCALYVRTFLSADQQQRGRARLRELMATRQPAFRKARVTGAVGQSATNSTAEVAAAKGTAEATHASLTRPPTDPPPPAQPPSDPPPQQGLP